MKKSNQAVKSIVTIMLLVSMASCSNKAPTTIETTDSIATAAPSSTEDPAFTPFKVMMIKHTVADFEKWKSVFVSHEGARKESGQTDLALLRGADNANQVMIIEKIDDVQKAKDFTTSPTLKEAMQKAGVTSAPEFSYYDVVRNDDSKIDTKSRVMITHKVKDFDAWLKVYDGEGMATRAAEGMVDRVIARGIDDPNMVHIVFAITDMTKAKAAITSEAKKKIMMSAGVDGPPTIEFYTMAE